LPQQGLIAAPAAATTHIVQPCTTLCSVVAGGGAEEGHATYPCFCSDFEQQRPLNFVSVRSGSM
jgi:hypothetical protein